MWKQPLASTLTSDDAGMPVGFVLLSAGDDGITKGRRNLTEQRYVDVRRRAAPTERQRTDGNEIIRDTWRQYEERLRQVWRSVKYTAPAVAAVKGSSCQS